MKRILAIAVIALVVTSCNMNYEKTPSGLVYKIFNNKKNGKPVKGAKFVKLNIEYSLQPKDTILNTTYGKVPLYTPLEGGDKQVYSFMELVPKCKEGDSVIFTLMVDSLKNRQMLTYNETFKRGDQIKCKMSILKVFANEEEIRADYEKEIAVEKDREIRDLQVYMKKKGINGEQTKSGAFVAVENAGDANLKAVTGKTASIKYKGYLQDGGRVFDTNMDSSKGHTDPIDVAVGSGSVIPAWEEALPYFGKGGKGKILVPAMLGYGPQGSPGAIPPFANLVFDIEVLDIKDTPAASAKPANGGLTPEQIQALKEQMQKAQQNGSQQQNAPRGGK